MKKLTYARQILVGLILLSLGHLLSWVTGWQYFQNLGWIAYGLLFLIHPVWLESASQNPRIKTYVRIAGAVVILIGLMLRVGGEDDYLQRHISESIGVDVSSGAVEIHYDDHGGFQGEGTGYAVLSFNDENLEQGIASPGGWKKLPLTDNLQTLIYGTRTETKATGPFIGVTFPKVEEGYWYFYDRQGKTESDKQVLDRNSYNYTFAIYDAENNRLYVCEYDT